MRTILISLSLAAALAGAASPAQALNLHVSKSVVLNAVNAERQVVVRPQPTAYVFGLMALGLVDGAAFGRVSAFLGDFRD